MFSDLHSDPVQTKEVATRGDDLPSKRNRRILLAARAEENTSNSALESASGPSDNSRSRGLSSGGSCLIVYLRPCTSYSILYRSRPSGFRYQQPPRSCGFPLTQLYYEVLGETGKPANVGLSWGFRSLLGAMYLQLVWHIKSRQCQARGCNNIIGLHERSNKETCSTTCKQRRKYHRDRAAAKRRATSRAATVPINRHP